MRWKLIKYDWSWFIGVEQININNFLDTDSVNKIKIRMNEMRMNDREMSTRWINESRSRVNTGDISPEKDFVNTYYEGKCRVLPSCVSTDLINTHSVLALWTRVVYKLLHCRIFPPITICRCCLTWLQRQQAVARWTTPSFTGVSRRHRG